MEQIYTPKQDYKVLVRCFTYNQSKYIEETLNGFAMQKTNFLFTCLVMDDCSTDGEQDVIKAWMERECDMNKAEYIDLELSDVILVSHKSNENCTFAFYLLKRNLWKECSLKSALVQPWRTHCEYEAICEGDDFWIDNRKLQKQVDFLDTHPDYSFCCHRFKIFDQNNNRYLKEYGYSYYTNEPILEISEEILVKTWVTQILTTMIRLDNLWPVLKQCENYKKYRDWHLYYYLLKEGNGASLNEIMGVYRWHDGGIASSLNGSERFISQYKVIKEIYDNHPDDVYLKYKIRYNLIRLLRYSDPSQSTYKYLKEALSSCDTYSQKINAIISFLIPVGIFNVVSNYYSKKRLERSEIK